MNDERLVFSAIKAYRGWYIVEYAPPVHETPFATLSLTTLKHADPAKVAEAIEAELACWLARYPVPIMVSAFGDAGTLLDVSAVRACNHLFGWLDAETRSVTAHWRVVQSTELPVLDLRPTALRRLYSDVPFKTGGDLRKTALKQQWAIGLWPKTASDLAAADEDQRMRHHHYHCERNPEGFRRLVAENFERESGLILGRVT